MALYFMVGDVSISRLRFEDATVTASRDGRSWQAPAFVSGQTFRFGSLDFVADEGGNLYLQAPRGRRLRW